MRVGADHREIRAVSDAIVDQLVAPADGPGVCPLCRTWSTNRSANGSTAPCENCVETQVILGMTPQRLSVVSLYSKPSDLRDWLTRYKGRDDEDDPFDPACLTRARAILGRMLIEHGEDLAAALGPVDGIAVVPSTSRPAPHPLEELIATLDLDMETLPLLRRGPGDLGFRKPSIHGYTAREHPAARVLLIDDVYTTGSRINSAAFALAQAGHRVSGGLVLARRINTDYAQQAQDLWTRASANSFDWEGGPWI